MKPWAAYIRVSAVGNRDRNTLRGPEEQRSYIAAWANARREPVEYLPPELDRKGDDATRPTLRRAVEGVRQGKYRGVVIGYISRAARDLRLTLDLWDEIESVGGEVWSARENLNASTADGRLHRNLLASIAQHELEQHRERFQALRQYATDAGIWQRRQTPRGYTVDPDRHLIPDKQAAEVRQAFQARAAGTSFTDIARQLGMTHSGARELLRNRVYLGELRIGQFVNPDAHPPLITPDLFDRAQLNHARPGRTHTRQPALLAGLVRCAGCGHAMSNGHKVYACRGKHAGCQCPQGAAIAVPKLDAYVDQIARHEMRRLTARPVENMTSIAEARQRVAAAQAELTSYASGNLVAVLGPEAFMAGAETRRDELDRARAELDALLAQQPLAPILGDFDTTWNRLPSQRRNHVLRGLIEVIIVQSGTTLDRVRVIRQGTGIRVAERRGHEPAGIVPLRLPDADDPCVLRPLGVQNGL